MTVAPSKQWREALPVILAALIIGLVLLAIAYKGTAYPGDHSQILQRYAAQLGAGNGLVFNAGERVLLIPSPLYMLALAVFGIRITFLIALMIIAGSLYFIARSGGLSYNLALLSAGAGILTWPLWMGIQTAYPLMTALCLLALALAFAERWALSGFVLALAILCSPEAGLLAIVLLIVALNKGAGWLYGLSLILPLGLAVSLLYAYYGSSLWEGLLLLKPTPGSSFNLFELIVGAALLCLAGWSWWRDRANPVVAVAASWIAIYLLVVGGLLRSADGWRYAPACLIVLLAVFGLRPVNAIGRSAGYVLMISVLGITSFIAASGGTVAPIPFQGINATIGLANLPMLETMSFTPQQSLVVLDGQTQPDLKVMLERGDPQSALVRYAPNMIFFEADSPLLDWKTGDNWQRLGYIPMANNVYQRNVDVGDFVTQPLNVAFGPDMRLTGVALDKTSLKPGDVVRVRLDWEIAKSANTTVTVDLRLNNEDWVYAHATDNYQQTVFTAGSYSTYHTLAVEDNAPPGQYQVQVGLLISDGVIPHQAVAQLEVK